MEDIVGEMAVWVIYRTYNIDNNAETLDEKIKCYIPNKIHLNSKYIAIFKL